jgi:uncharacterized protein (TIGR02246 family)
MAELVPMTLKNFTEAFNAHDAAKFAAQFAPDAVTTEYGGMDAHGREEIQKQVQMFFDMSSDAKGAAASLWGKGNMVAVDWVTAGTMTGDFMGIKASKKPIGGHRLVIGTLGDDGLMTMSHEYMDFPGLMAQMKGAKDAPEVPSVPATTAMHMAKGTPEEDKLVEWVKTFNDAFNKDDPKAVTAMIAPEGDVQFFFMGGKVLKAGKELDKFSADFRKAMPKAQWAIVSSFAADGFVVAERTQTGTMKGKMGPVPPTNKEVTIHVAEIFQPTADGKLSHGWAFGNMGELMPPPKAPPMKDTMKDKDKDKGAAPAMAPKAAPAAAPAAPAAAPKK